MTPGPSFDLAVALLFAVPGPTNALIAVAGARRGTRAIPIVAGAALVGFIVAVGALIGIAGPYFATRPALASRCGRCVRCCSRVRPGGYGGRPASQRGETRCHQSRPTCWRRLSSTPKG